jgi:hypothetical protein
VAAGHEARQTENQTLKPAGVRLLKVLPNTGRDRVVDAIRPGLQRGVAVDVATSELSLYAFAELREELGKAEGARLIVPEEGLAGGLLGGVHDRAERNMLRCRWLAGQFALWIRDRVRCRRANGLVPQGAVVLRGPDGDPTRALLGSFGLTREGLGLAPGNPMSLIQSSESAAEAAQFAQWFELQWTMLEGREGPPDDLANALGVLSSHPAPEVIYALVLHHLLGGKGDALDEEQVVKSATGIKNTRVWRKLYKFQRDGVVGAIDKLNRFGGCIIADSVGLGKTFEALAIIKYHELRNDRVLVLCPKRLRENWTLYRANDRRNILAEDRFNFDVLNHTDLSRDAGFSGDIDLAHVNWGNYDLVVIDESHNFRNKASPKKGGETRYDRLMRRIIREGVKTRVLMLSATPVNNRLADLRNQIAFIVEGQDHALAEHGIESIEATTRKAQREFNRWLELPEGEREPRRLVEMLGFDYFSLLDLLTIARSRRHVEKYYGTEETGRFPERLRPVNIRADVDLEGRFPSIEDVNREIRRLNLASYAPLRYVLAHRKEAYDEKYSQEVRGGTGFFRQADREESLIHLLRVNILKRMESSVHAFALTIERQLRDVEATLTRIEAHHDDFEELDISDIDQDDPAFEALLVGKKVRVLLSDVDLIRWRHDLLEDRNRLRALLSSAREVTARRDAKLSRLRELIQEKCRNPINPGNRKILLFSAFAETAAYLYQDLSVWAKAELGIEAALVTGSGGNDTTLRGLRKDMSSVLTAFSPRSKERPEDMADEGEIDLLIATDCISEGQNLQDCDCVVNYDVHWNPVRVIQRFGRIDRLASPNDQIQLVNFWPNLELEEYINLEQRVSGRMVLLDISATGEENVIEQQSGDPMNDLEYRRRQLLKLQDSVIDLEDLSSGVSITDLTLSDFRIDLADFRREHPGQVEGLPQGLGAVVLAEDAEVMPGVIFCLRAEGEAATRAFEPGYPLAPHYLVHVGEDGTVVMGFPEAKRILDQLKRLGHGRSLPDPEACRRLDALTTDGRDTKDLRRQLEAAVGTVTGTSEERAVESLFKPGGTHARRGEFAGLEDFEVLAYLVVLPAS